MRLGPVLPGFNLSFPSAASELPASALAARSIAAAAVQVSGTPWVRQRLPRVRLSILLAAEVEARAASAFVSFAMLNYSCQWSGLGLLWLLPSFLLQDLSCWPGFPQPWDHRAPLESWEPPPSWVLDTEGVALCAEAAGAC